MEPRVPKAEGSEFAPNYVLGRRPDLCKWKKCFFSLHNTNLCQLFCNSWNYTFLHLLNFYLFTLGYSLVRDLCAYSLLTCWVLLHWATHCLIRNVHPHQLYTTTHPPDILAYYEAQSSYIPICFLHILWISTCSTPSLVIHTNSSIIHIFSCTTHSLTHILLFFLSTRTTPYQICLSYICIFTC